MISKMVESIGRTCTLFSARSHSSSSLYKEETRLILRWSVSVLRSLNVSRAGKRLGVLQPEVAKSIQVRYSFRFESVQPNTMDREVGGSWSHLLFDGFAIFPVLYSLDPIHSQPNLCTLRICGVVRCRGLVDRCRMSGSKSTCYLKFKWKARYLSKWNLSKENTKHLNCLRSNKSSAQFWYSWSSSCSRPLKKDDIQRNIRRRETYLLLRYFLLLIAVWRITRC